MSENLLTYNKVCDIMISTKKQTNKNRQTKTDKKNSICKNSRRGILVKYKRKNSIMKRKRAIPKST